MVFDKDSEKSETEIETSESMKDLNFPQESYAHFPNISFLDELNEKDKNDPRFQAKFKRSRHNYISVLTISQD